MGLTLTDELKKTLATRPGDLVIVAGAGITIGALHGDPLAELASWQGLLGSALAHLQQISALGSPDIARLQALIDSDDPDIWIDAAQKITQSLGGPRGGEMRVWLRNTVGAFSGAVRNREVLDALRALNEQGALLATVNYDGLLTTATGLPPVTWRDAARVQRLIRGDDRGVLHLHGHWEDPASIVLGARSYDDIVADEHTRTVLKSLAMQRTLVFVGHGAGLRDPNWGSFLRWVEAVLSGGEYRHYRLVRDGERARVQSEHPPGQRVVTLAYGADHRDLGPFLRALCPPRVEPTVHPAPLPTPVQTFVLQLNIGDRDHHWLSEQEARELADAPDPVVLPCARIIDRAAITARQWRALAQQVDALLATMRAAITLRTPARIIVTGQAPLPVFAYLGQQMRRDRARVTVINHRQGSPDWDHIGTPEPPPADVEDRFAIKPPSLGRVRRGKVVLSIQCSNEYGYTEDMVEPMLAAEGATLLCSYEIHHKYDHRKVPMTADDLAVLLGHVEVALQWIKRECPDSDGLIVAMGGPSWVAFWIANRLNANVRGRIDYPNRVIGQGYVRALAAPMHRAPWFTCRARLMIMTAEPDDQGSTRAGRAADAIRQALEQELGPDGPYEVRTRGATKIADIMRELDRFKPDILHLHLHISASGDLAFEDERGETKRISGAAFAGMLAATDVRPALIVLSGCHSNVLAPSMTELAECVISMTGEMAFKLTITFSAGFYAALGRGHTVDKALAQGKRLAEAEHTRVDAPISLHGAPGVDPAEIVLFPGQT